MLNNEEFEGSGASVIPAFNRESVERLPQNGNAYVDNYYGAASKIGRNLQNNYYGRFKSNFNF